MGRMTPTAANPTPSTVADVLPGIEDHPHALAVLGPALPPRGSPSHAYLFHGPPGTGKRAIARAFAGALLADGAPHPHAAAARVAHGAHPDLTWVIPSGAAEMLVGDIDQAVVAAATRTPFESRRRVFVLEDAHTLNDQAANRLLKTLEEPPPFVHLILLAGGIHDVLPTITSRCQHVRFDPLSSAAITARLHHAPQDARSPDPLTGHPSGATLDEDPPLPDDPLYLDACARLARGDAQRARLLAGARGRALREHAERFVADALGGNTAARSWLGLLADAKAAGAAAGEHVQQRLHDEAELLPRKERKRHERDGADARRRAERRARTGALDLALALAQLTLRDAWCIAHGAEQIVYAVDRRVELRQLAAAHTASALRDAVALVAETRLRLPLNVSEELALDALAYRLHALGARHPPSTL
jgi:DNA polymerase-3 subunit delta'